MPLTPEQRRQLRRACAVVVELPIRVAGGQLPCWDDLEALLGMRRWS